MISGANHILTSGGEHNLVMFRRFTGRRRRSAPKRTASIQHSPSTMDQQMLSNKGTVVVSVTPNLNAGGSMGSERLSTDRLNDVANGSKIGQISYTLQMEPDATAVGTIEWLCFRMERQFAAPVLGTNPLPTDAEITSSGLQQMMRSNLPGWVMKFGAFPISPELPSVRTIAVSPSRMGMGPIKDGDYSGIVLFNRTSGPVNFSVQMRFKSFR